MVKESFISGLFSKSPFVALQEHMEQVGNCVSHLPPFMKAVLQENWEDVDRIGQQISEFEQMADDIKRDIRIHLPRSLFMPVARGDILELLSTQDEVANRVRDISGLIRGRRMVMPETIQEGMERQLQHALSAANFANQAVHEVDTLIMTSFSKHELEVVEKYLNGLNEAESQADSEEVRVRAALFAVEKSLYPVDVIFLYRIIEMIGDIADLSQRVGNRILYLVAR